ncbi:hypothetical protein [Alkalihalobacterium chitinilyticum]|uniref:Phage portal protein n=1 Tax=Alkalihalobacterium chitinilyticum TaxID=2980103 RepID=A0ABT5V9A7_9BACI|nr:hypothetical protein [Alkalihalobacterium chitinilyticum]MDE5412025.1 hypothetical protein [Alkalihalobacterium chitinilyticum]
MIIIKAEGIELEKEKPNTSEDFFNRSTVTYTDNGQEKELNVLYVRFFDEKSSEISPFKENPILATNQREVTFKDIVALVCLLQNPGNKEKKRIYINELKEMEALFRDVDPEQIKGIMNNLVTQGKSQL